MSDKTSIAVLTSGGDAPGMNAVVRAVIRTALQEGAQPYAILEGWHGAIAGGDYIRKVTWSDASSILDQGGTVIGSARSSEFREREGRRTAAGNLARAGIDRLVVVGGDGSLTGADILRSEWADLLKELVEAGELDQAVADKHPELRIAGVVGSIDNDLVGTDMTVGTNSALARIVDAIDALTSTATSHQRTFIVEVMGRRCGYLALMGAIAGGCDYVIIPEIPPVEGWEEHMCNQIRKGRESGRRDSLIVVAEGCKDRHGERITSQRIQQIIFEKLGDKARITALGHVQRGGTPSAFDRWMSTLLGYTAALEIIRSKPGEDSCIIGLRENHLVRLPLVETVANTQKVVDYMESGEYEAAAGSRGPNFHRMLTLFSTISSPVPVINDDLGRKPRVAVMHAGGLAPGMNPAARAAVRFGISAGFEMLGVENGFVGLIENHVRPLEWRDVDGWASRGGAELGTDRKVPTIDQYFALARAIEANGIDAIIMIGGKAGYDTAWAMASERNRFPSFNIPFICVPTTIDNNLPGSDLTIGADTALNTNVEAIDKIRRSASASRRTFVVEVMGRKCGYLAMMSALSTGAEQVYLSEVGVSLDMLKFETERMNWCFTGDRSLYLAIRNEQASQYYTADLMRRVFEEEGHGKYTARTAIIGHMQQGGMPTSYDRTLAISMAANAVDEIKEQLKSGRSSIRYLGMHNGHVVSHPILHMDEQIDPETGLPQDPWWLTTLPVLYVMGQKGYNEPLEDLKMYRKN
ncbi:6-phosphofructokinase [Actinotignum urinale]|uniref:6-phosphofructokinase n=1 Tax=Actinotignum urinale TaxID=190146 RepID=A0AAW9HT18_9ACTO|nr:6-phosphofructokinase [Actinotignum urinale]MDY5128997.1 6-phosphofructokinase [Actinotignum urinale]MDY5154798.1 6-phosphofructokinase [Actinotignum urinale]